MHRSMMAGEDHMKRQLMIWSLPRALTTLAIVAAIGAAISFQPDRGLAQDSAAVTIENFAFNPASVTVTAGATVTWTNNDAAPHTATGDGGEFDTGTIASGGSASVTFDTPGTYTYHCTIHPNMTATIIVEAAGGTDGGNSGGTPELPNTGAGIMGNGPLGISALAIVLFALSVVLGLGGRILARAPLPTIARAASRSQTRRQFLRP